MPVMRPIAGQRQGIRSETMPAIALFTGISAVAGETVSQGTYYARGYRSAHRSSIFSVCGINALRRR
jgi:hypothetical protein